MWLRLWLILAPAEAVMRAKFAEIPARACARARLWQIVSSSDTMPALYRFGGVFAVEANALGV